MANACNFHDNFVSCDVVGGSRTITIENRVLYAIVGSLDREPRFHIVLNGVPADTNQGTITKVIESKVKDKEVQFYFRSGANELVLYKKSQV